MQLLIFLLPLAWAVSLHLLLECRHLQAFLLSLLGKKTSLQLWLLLCLGEEFDPLTVSLLICSIICHPFLSLLMVSLVVLMGVSHHHPFLECPPTSRWIQVLCSMIEAFLRISYLDVFWVEIVIFICMYYSIIFYYF